MWSRISFCILYLAFRGVHYLNHKKEGKTWNLMYKRHEELFTDDVIKLNTALQWLVISKSSYFLIPCPILFKFSPIFFKYLKLYNKSNLVWRFWFPLTLSLFFSFFFSFLFIFSLFPLLFFFLLYFLFFLLNFFAPPIGGPRPFRPTPGSATALMSNNYG